MQTPSPAFADLLRTYRERAGLSHADLGRRLFPERTRQAVWTWEYGSVPARETVDAIATALDLPQADRISLLQAAGYVVFMVSEPAP